VLPTKKAQRYSLGFFFLGEVAVIVSSYAFCSKIERNS